MGEGEVCMVVLHNGEMEDEKSPRIETKRDHEGVGGHTDAEPCAKKQAREAPSDDTELETCAKKQVTEASNDDVCSEVSNPILSPREIACSVQTISSQPAELVCNTQVGSGETSSTCSGNSSTKENPSEEEHIKTDTCGEVSKSHCVLEIPEHVSSTGIRKITFKFSKRKEDYDDQFFGLAVQPVVDMNAEISTDREVFHEGSDGLLCHPNMELKMSKKVVLDYYPTNVKKLLSTGILEGARVKYISTSGEILSAYEFELHAGGKTRHPNKHIYLENGKPIDSIIQEVKTAPFSVLDEVMKNIAGTSVNEESFQYYYADTKTLKR
ncbi:acyl-CoA N-acyltransferase with RING/FYVE/PHD-type zinc finger domain-containing protein [Actinidia rufa]|uniref:Acyl-CoA N-acyltransferase with RING/FYVE/PHD-type zinc finger domain-containing protein n=1 Tax=Actinidia rufa TaxID=165716 RepID=A0A7J0FVU0_9ERIC|nr:acyl-CoA N-acyltransferase with RING/FYVE/PHD-type zinc finger domain-containing protein [Actinidia rufa]